MVHLRGVGSLQTEDIAGKLNHHALHTEANAEGGHVVLATPFQGNKLTLDATLTESGGNDHAVHVVKLLINVILSEFL